MLFRSAPLGTLGGAGRQGPSCGRAQPSCRLQFRTLKPEEQRQALRSLELHYQAFLRDSQDAGGFGPEDRLQAEREYGSCSRHYQQLLQSLEQGRQVPPGGGGGRQGGSGVCVVAGGRGRGSL